MATGRLSKHRRRVAQRADEARSRRREEEKLRKSEEKKQRRLWGRQGLGGSYNNGLLGSD